MSLEGDGVQVYTGNKDKLMDALRRNGNSSVLSRPEHGHVGIWNQGATCYLNSIAQALCSDNEFRNALFALDAEEGSVTKELQRLCAQLNNSDQLAVSTKGLTTAFGWKNGQAQEQHDAHEMFGLLIDSLSGGNAKSLFEAKVKDCLVCPTCTNAQSNPSSCYTISVDIPDGNNTTLTEVEPKDDAVLDNNGHTFSKLTELLQSYYEPEELDADNRWNCEKCEAKVQATKSQVMETFPNKLMIQLKRFRFDPMARRRRKLNSSVLFPMTLTSKDLIYQGNTSETDPEAKYELSSVILHTGTAQGGHYRSYCKDSKSKKWFDYNDANVTELDEQDESSLFWFDNSKDTNIVDACEKGVLSSKRDMIYENAYMLCYSRVIDTEIPVTVYPPALLEEIQKQNEEFKELQAAYEIMKNIVTITAVAAKTDGQLISNESVTLEVKIDGTLADTTQLIYNALVEKKLVVGGLTSDAYRLRRFNSTSLWVMNTFTGKEEQTLKSLGLEGTTVIPLAFEVKLTPEDAFGDFNPNEMRVRMFNWVELVAVGYDKTISTADAGKTEGDSATESPRSSFNSYDFPTSVKANVVVIPGEQNASIKDLREMLAKEYEVTADRVNIIRCNQRNVTSIDDDEKSFKDFNIYPDEEMIVEIIPEDAIRSTYSSVALEKLLQMRRNITISFNNPLSYTGNTEGGSDENIYTFSLKAPLETTLLDVKAMIVNIINEASTDKSNLLEVGNFHVRRNANAPQIKHEKSTLEELELVNNSVLHVQMGAGCKPGEFLLHFVLDCNYGSVSAAIAQQPSTGIGEISGGVASSNTPNTFLIGDLKIREKMKVAEVKQIVFDRITEMISNANANPNDGNNKQLLMLLPSLPNVNHLRLRDGKKTGGPLRDERVIGRCLLNMDDGRKVLVQSLIEPEIISADDIVLSLRVASYYNKTLAKPIDYPINKNTTVTKLYEMLLEKFPFLAEEVSMVEDSGGAPPTPGAVSIDFKPAKLMSIAKGFGTGPPLTLKSALKLKWNDDLVLKDIVANPENTIDKLPLNLRDGSVLVVRSNADFERAKSAVQAKKAANSNNENAIAPGDTSVRSRLASRSGSRARLSSSSSASSLREPSLKINSDAQSTGEVPAGGAVRMVQALKDTTNTTEQCE